MTVVPASFQLAGWIPAWWRGVVGGDDMLGLIGGQAMAELATLRQEVAVVTAFSPALGIGVLPGPRPSTQAAVAAGEAVILHAAGREPSHLLIPDAGGWSMVACDPPRPCDLNVRQAAADMAEAVVIAEHSLREGAADVAAQVEPAQIRPLPPDADSSRRGLLVRAVRLWTAVDCVPIDRRPPQLQQVLAACARATLAAYMDPLPVGHSDRTGHVRRMA